MGMYNAIIDDELLNPLGIYKERLSPVRALRRDARRCPTPRPQAVRTWLDAAACASTLGTRRGDRADRRAARRASARCTSPPCASPTTSAATPSASSTSRASRTSRPRRDLAEGLLNNVERPAGAQPRRRARAVRRPSRCRTSTRSTRAPPSTRWSPTGSGPRWASTRRPRCTTSAGARTTTAEFVWVFEISGSVPASHLIGGYARRWSERQPPMYFPLGGGTLKGVSKPGEIVWCRVFVDGRRAARRHRPRAPSSSCRTRRPSAAGTRPTPQWPIMHAVLHGVTRDQFMARHKANHLQVAYAPDADTADRALRPRRPCSRRSAWRSTPAGSRSAPSAPAGDAGWSALRLLIVDAR